MSETQNKMEYQHTPVMLKEVMEILEPKPGQYYADCTLGGGGYTAAILKSVLPGGKVLSLDLDELAINNAEQKFKTEIKSKNLIIVHGNFKNLQSIVENSFEAGAKLDGLVLDLGLSSAQLKDRSRGFSFNLADSPLSMSFGGETGQTAESIINNWQIKDLTEIFREYGEEKFAYKIALAVAAARQEGRIATAGQLAEIIIRAVPKRFQSKIHPATKVFQALRMEVNQEMENLRLVLPQALGLLKSGGRITVISYHSLEDRLVKQFFKEQARGCLCPPTAPICQCGHQPSLEIKTKKVSRPSEVEVIANPRSRSAKLRAAEKI